MEKRVKELGDVVMGSTRFSLQQNNVNIWWWSKFKSIRGNCLPKTRKTIIFNNQKY